MANLAERWHWPLESMDRMSVGELMRWHGHAAERARLEREGK